MNAYFFGCIITTTFLWFQRWTIKFIRFLNAINSYKPMITGISFFKIRQIKVFIAYYGISCAIKSSWSSENIKIKNNIEIKLN